MQSLFPNPRYAVYRDPRTPAGLLVVVPLAAALLVLGCQAEPVSTGPELATVAASRTLRVSGGGTGSGRVTAPNHGDAGPLDCQITMGTYDPIQCTKTYGRNTVVVLTAAPDPGSAFNR